MKIEHLKKDMMIVGMGLITDVPTELDMDGNYMVSYYCIHSGYDGEVSQAMEPDEEYEILMEEGSSDYLTFVNKLINYMEENISYFEMCQHKLNELLIK